jgi:hypothetical protein
VRLTLLASMLLDAFSLACGRLEDQAAVPPLFLFLFLLKRYLWFHEGGVKLVAVELRKSL